jgi:CHAT domain
MADAAGHDVRLLTYSVTVDRVFAVELGRGFTREHDLGPSAKLLDAYDAVQRELSSPAALSQPTLPALERFAAEWGRALLPSLWLSDPPQYGVLIPHALLHALPLHLIRTDSGNPLCAAAGVSLCSSLTLLKHCLGRAPTRKRVDPLMDDGGQPTRSFAAGADVLGSSDEAWRRLPARLLDACGAAVDGPDPEAPPASFRDVVARMLAGHAYELIVIAAHGYHDRLDALTSGLLLRQNQLGFMVRTLDVPASSSDTDGTPYRTQDLPVRELPAHLEPTRPAELLALAELERSAHIVCPLVALLGCSTGRAVLYPGDQPLSLAETFMRIGAAAVLAPMWDVGVTAVEAWMRAFLQAYWVEGVARAEAARRASRDRVDDGAPLHEAGCLVLRGDYRERSLP